jgi:ferric-dicitrate binding protein FerR (iron transport regulator)
MTDQEVQQLLERYAQGLCTPEERALVERWYMQESAAQSFHQEDLPEDAQRQIWQQVRTVTGRTARVRQLTRTKIAAAACVLLALGAVWYLTPQRASTSPVVAATQPVPIKPGGDKATLTLADGSTIILNDTTGVLAVQSGITVRQSEEGIIVYEKHGGHAAAATNTPQKIQTPRGGQYQVQLPDGTHVWINAASELVFPAAFTGSIRKVKLKGEAYFEVAKNKHRPFVVETDGMNILVTGTHFNVMAYPNEGQSTATLLEGSVQVSHASDQIQLSPGEQAVTDRRQKFSKSKVDTETAVAWKNGLFRFDNDDIETVMRQLCRWYNVQVVYQGAKPTNRFGGYISRTSELSQVLKMLELSGLHVQVKERTIIVL